VDWPLVGRSSELGSLIGALNDGRTRGAVVSGASGVGKTRLVRELVAQAAADGRVTAWVVGSRSMAEVSLGAFAHLLPGEEVATSGALEVARRVCEQVRRLSPDRPLVLGIDDAQLLDGPSAGLAHQLAAIGAAFVVATVRSGERVPDAVCALWKDGLAERVELRPMSRTETGVLLSGVLGGPVEQVTVHRLWAVSGGNVLFLRELVVAGREQGRLTDRHGIWSWHGELAGGGRLSELIEDRLAGLSDDQRGGMELLAVGEPLPTAVFEALAGSGVARALEARGLLAVTMDGRRSTVRTAHPLYAETLRAGIGPLHRRAMYRRLAAALAHTGARRREDTLRLALWQLDGDGVNDPAVLNTAARRAIWLFDHRLAERLARAAAYEEGQTEALVLLAEALLWQGRADECRGVLETVNVPTIIDPRILGDWAFIAATNAFWGLGDVASAESILMDAESRLPAGDHRDRLTGQRALILFFAGRPADAVTAAEPAHARPTAGVEARLRVGGALILGSAALGRSERAILLAEGLLEDAESQLQEEPLLLSELQGALHYAYWQAGRFADMRTACSAIYDELTAARAHDLRGTIASQLGRALLGLGKPRTARDRLREAAMALRVVDVVGVLPLALAWTARCAAQLGDLDEAHAAMAECDRRRRPALGSFDTDVLLARAWIAAAEGRHSAARGLAHAGRDGGGRRRRRRRPLRAAAARGAARGRTSG
jgi:tetratricopeptide (TPR) repeat protein